MLKMKRIGFIAVLFLFVAGVERLEAQNWLESLKGVVSEVVDEATGGKLTQIAIKGSWNYAAPGIRMGSEDVATNLAGAALESTIEEKLKTAYEKIGVRPGSCTITFGEENYFSMTMGTRTVEGSYTFDPESHLIELTVGRLKTKVNGYAYIDGTNLELLFPIDKLVSFVTAIGSKVSALSTLSAMLSKYDEVQLGFAFSK